MTKGHALSGHRVYARKSISSPSLAPRRTKNQTLRRLLHRPSPLEILSTRRWRNWRSARKRRPISPPPPTYGVKTSFEPESVHFHISISPRHAEQNQLEVSDRSKAGSAPRSACAVCWSYLRS